jgi:hypothetical protein
MHFSANVPIDSGVSYELFNGGSTESCGRQIGIQSGVLEEHTLGWQGSRLTTSASVTKGSRRNAQNLFSTELFKNLL